MCCALSVTIALAVLGGVAAGLTGAVSTVAAVDTRRLPAPAALGAAAREQRSGPCRRLVPGRTERVNVESDGMETTTPVLRAAVSANGRLVAFSSAAATLVPRDRNGHTDVFVRDLVARRTTRVSVSATGGDGDGASFYPSISADGRFLAFRSFARNLVKDDRNGVEDVFVHDRATGSTERVSVGNAGAEANGPSVTSSISGDGSVVAFSSPASNLVRGDRNEVTDVFVRDRGRGRTLRVSVGPGEANGTSEGSGISRDGRAVVFRSSATNLVRADTNGYPDVFVRDWARGTTERVNVSSAGGEANHETYRGSISGDGRHVAFRSEASNLVTDDTNGAQDVFAHDRRSHRTVRLSVSTHGAQAKAPPSRRTAPGQRFMSRAFLSRSGRFAAFGSHAANLVAGDTNGRADVFIRDLATRQTRRVSVAVGGAQSNGHSFVMGLSEDGSVVVFVSSAANLVRGDTNRVRDAFVRISGHCASPPP